VSCCDVCSEVSDDDGNSQSNGDKKSESSDEGNNVDDDDVSDGDDQRVCRLFSLSFVNMYGNAEVSRLSDDGGQIKFGGSKHSLCVCLFPGVMMQQYCVYHTCDC